MDYNNKTTVKDLELLYENLDKKALIKLAAKRFIEIEDLTEKLNVMRSSLQLKEKETPTFWSWVNDNKLTVYQDGVFYNGNCYLISDLYRKYKREIEPNL